MPDLSEREERKGQNRSKKKSDELFGDQKCAKKKTNKRRAECPKYLLGEKIRGAGV